MLYAYLNAITPGGFILTCIACVVVGLLFGYSLTASAQMFKAAKYGEQEDICRTCKDKVYGIVRKTCFECQHYNPNAGLKSFHISGAVATPKGKEPKRVKQCQDKKVDRVKLQDVHELAPDKEAQ